MVGQQATFKSWFGSERPWVPGKRRTTTIRRIWHEQHFNHQVKIWTNGAHLDHEAERLRSKSPVNARQPRPKGLSRQLRTIQLVRQPAVKSHGPGTVLRVRPVFQANLSQQES